MCIIICNPDGKDVSDDILKESFTDNPHGIGIYFMDTKKITRFYGSGLPQLKNLLNKKKYIIHFRLSSVGSVNKKNIHPFHVDKRYLIFHNGTLPFRHKDDFTMSDTRIFSHFLTDFVKNGIDIMSPHFKKMFEMIDSRNKIVIVDKESNSYQILNENVGFWIDEVWYSKRPLSSVRSQISTYGSDLAKYEGSCTVYRYGTNREEVFPKNDRDVLDIGY